MEIKAGTIVKAKKGGEIRRFKIYSDSPQGPGYIAVPVNYKNFPVGNFTTLSTTSIKEVVA